MREVQVHLDCCTSAAEEVLIREELMQHADDEAALCLTLSVFSLSRS